MRAYRITFLSIWFSAFFLSTTACAQLTDRPAFETIWDQRAQAWIGLSDLQLLPGEILVIGEQHAIKPTDAARAHQGNQWRVLRHLGQSARVSVGMEFLAYPNQGVVDAYLAGAIDDAAFKKGVAWSGNAFELYRPQMLEPRQTGGVTLALNIPRSISGKVGRGGPSALSPDERALLPPIWERGQSAYFERFREVMSGHVNDAQIENLFWAQSLWDDTMAWNASKWRPDGLLAIIVGEFHVEYGHALPARLNRYGLTSVRTLLQVEVATWDEAARMAAVAPHPRYGPRADYIWVYKRY